MTKLVAEADDLIAACHGDARGCVASVTPAKAGWRHVGFEAYQLEAGESLTGGEPGREAPRRRCMRGSVSYATSVR